LTVQVVYEEGREYWVNGLVPATVARMIAEGKGIETGVHYLSTSVDPTAFMAELRKAGVEQTENFEPCEFFAAVGLAESLRSYHAKLIAVYAEKSQSWSAEKQPQYNAWIEWATRQADRLDPFISEKPPSVLDRRRELN
jgi:hypothetical protein